MAWLQPWDRPLKIEDHRPIRWQVITGEWGPMYAGGQLSATGFGNVGRNIGYDVYLSQVDLKYMDFEARLYARTLLKMIARYPNRIRVNYCNEDLWR